MEQFDFENEVKNIARQLWPDAIGGGSEIFTGKERDGIYITEDAVHLIECTISRTKEKAEKDVGKLSSLARQMQKKYPEKAIKGWFITKDEPTADQRTVAHTKGYLVTACSFETFQSRLINVSEYISCRLNYPFGSVRDPKTGEFKIHDEYIDIALNDCNNNKVAWEIETIINELLKGRHIIIQGQYGVGKSMALKEVYKRLNKRYNSKSITRFPVYLNLRDHHGQVNPVEAIERHARNIGFKHPEHIVRAWRSGYVLLILDGFDEIASLGWTGKSSSLKDIRYKSMELLREILRQNPTNTGILFAGRSNYFDSVKEISNALNLISSSCILTIGDFTPQQASKYLQQKKVSNNIPEWIPARPLLLGYLVAKGILSAIIESDGIDSPSEGWDFLLDEISKREAAIEAGLSPETVREIIEGIATCARKFQNGLGPIYQEDLERVFKEKCGYFPDDRALVLLQRLPGLAPQDQQDGSRYFIDDDFASVAKAGEILRYIINPYDYQISGDPRQWQETLERTGVELIGIKAQKSESNSLENAILCAKRIDANVLATDILMALNYIGKSWDRETIVFQDILIPVFEIKNENDWSRVTFKEVIFRELIIEAHPEKRSAPIFKNCYVGVVKGMSDAANLPSDIFIDISIDNYDVQGTTTAALMNLDFPVPQKVGLTILKKLYLQSGGGRQENSFYRGLSTNEQSYVTQVLEYLKQQKLAIPSKKANTNKVWQANKNFSGVIKNILLNRAYNNELINGLKDI